MSKQESTEKTVCPECGCDLMHVHNKESCADCIYNGVWDIETSEYIYPDTLNDGQVRNQADNEGYCDAFDMSNGHGCVYYKCSKCGHFIKQIPYLDN